LFLVLFSRVTPLHWSLLLSLQRLVLSTFLGTLTESQHKAGLMANFKRQMQGGTSVAAGPLRPHGNRANTAQAAAFWAGGGPLPVAFEYLVIGGGNGGDAGPGGNAGGYRTNVAGSTNGFGASLEPVLELGAGTYTVIVGAGGSASSGVGSASTFASISTTSGAGRTGLGAGGAGDGGPGLSNSITGTAVLRGGGGSSGGDYGNGNAGIDGGGGGAIFFNDFYGFGYARSTPAANKGGGGGGGYFGNGGQGGGSGVVIIRYLTAAAASSGYVITGGTTSTTGSYTVHSFTSTGTTSLVIA
jgi:hypothetical protein